MICITCKGPLKELFTSTYCPACEFSSNMQTAVVKAQTRPLYEASPLLVYNAIGKFLQQNIDEQVANKLPGVPIIDSLKGSRTIFPWLLGSSGRPVSVERKVLVSALRFPVHVIYKTVELITLVNNAAADLVNRMIEQAIGHADMRFLEIHTTGKFPHVIQSSDEDVFVRDSATSDVVMRIRMFFAVIPRAPERMP